MIYKDTFNGPRSISRKIIQFPSPCSRNEKNKPSSSKKNIKKNKGIPRSDTEKKEKEPMDMESMQRVIKQLINDIIDLKKNKGEAKKPFKPFMKKRTDSVP